MNVLFGGREAIIIDLSGDQLEEMTYTSYDFVDSPFDFVVKISRIYSLNSSLEPSCASARWEGHVDMIALNWRFEECGKKYMLFNI